MYYLLIGLFFLNCSTQEIKQTVDNEPKNYIELVNDTVNFILDNELVEQLPLTSNISKANISQNKKNIVIAEDINPTQE